MLTVLQSEVVAELAHGELLVPHAASKQAAALAATRVGVCMVTRSRVVWAPTTRRSAAKSTEVPCRRRRSLAVVAVVGAVRGRGSRRESECVAILTGRECLHVGGQPHIVGVWVSGGSRVELRPE